MKFSFLVIRGFALTLALCAVLSVTAYSDSVAPARDYSFTISTAQPWTDTGVDLQGGELLEISATAHAGGCDPNGMSGSPQGKGTLPVPSASAGALIAKLQEQGAAVLVGNSHQLKADQPGHL